MRTCSFCKTELPKGAHAKTCRVPECTNLLCSACYYRHHYCPEHIKSEQTEGIIPVSSDQDKTGIDGEYMTDTVAVDEKMYPDQHGLTHENETPELRKCRLAVDRFKEWLEFYTKLVDPADMKLRLFGFSLNASNTPYAADVTLHFKAGSDLRIVLLCTCDKDDVTPGPVEQNTELEHDCRSTKAESQRITDDTTQKVNRLLGEYFAKNPLKEKSSQMGIGVFHPSGLPESSGEKSGPEDPRFWNRIDTGGISVFIITEKNMWHPENDRIARSIKNLLSPMTTGEAEVYIRKNIQQLFRRYIHVLAETVVEETGFPMEFVMHVTKKMVQEKICRYRKTQNGIEIIRMDV
jgi:hypothetical protein